MADKIDAIATLNVEDHKPNREYKLAMLLKIGKKSSSFDDSFEQENLNFLSADHGVVSCNHGGGKCSKTYLSKVYFCKMHPTCVCS